MKAIVKIILMLVLVNGAGRAGWATWNYYQLRDAAQQAVTLGVLQAPEEIHQEIADRAAELQLPIAAEAIVVKRNGSRTTADATYTQPVELFPTYTYTFNFSFNVESVTMMGLK